MNHTRLYQKGLNDISRKIYIKKIKMFNVKCKKFFSFFVQYNQ